jgi:hypothetical protein
MNAFTTLLAALVLVGATGGGARGASPDPTAAGGDPGPVYVDSTEILYLESWPVQVRLVVRGNLPDPCHEPVFEVQDLGDRIDVLLWSLADPDRMCIQVLEPFELSIPLGTWETANLPVLLNGEEIGRIELGEGAGEGLAGPSLVAAGWSFGFCLEYCYADLAIEGDDLILTGRDRPDEDPIFVNRGTLTPEGRALLDAAIAELEGVALEPVYGCPDCADGGAFYIELHRDDVVERVAMEFGSPPDVLAEAYAFSASVIGALEACQSSELVEVAEDCVPVERG